MQEKYVKCYLRYSEEGITVQVPRLDTPFVVLEHDFDEGAVSDVKNVGFDFNVLHLIGIWVVRDTVVLENLISNAEVLSELERCLWVCVRDPAQRVPKLAIDLSLSVHELDGASDVNLSVVVRALWVRSSGAGCQVPPERAELVQRPSPANGSRR